LTTLPPGPAHSTSVMSSGQVSAGGLVSSTVTVKVQVAVLPLESVAVQVTVVTPPVNRLPEAGTQVMSTTVPHTSLATGSSKVTAVPPDSHSMPVMSSGQVMSGGVVSSTVMEKVHELVLPLASVAVHVTSVVPSGKVLPGAGTQTTVGSGSHASEAPTSNSTTALPVPEHSTVMSSGQLISGSAVSTTSMSKLHVPVLPAESVAVQVTVVVPTGKTLPEAALHVGVRSPSQASVAVTVYSTTAPPEVSHSTPRMSSGQETTGSVSSTTTTSNVHVSVLPLESVAVQVTVVVPKANTLPEGGSQVTTGAASQRSVAVGSGK
jgi:hypothetical protein